MHAAAHKSLFLLLEIVVVPSKRRCWENHALGYGLEMVTTTVDSRCPLRTAVINTL
jgi:hypothetical protein